MTTAKEIQDYIDKHMESWVRETVLDEVIRYAFAANMPIEFIKNIRIERKAVKNQDTLATKSTNYKYQLVNDWKRERKGETFPLAIFFEYGTKDHWIAPVHAKVLAWSHPFLEGGQKRAYGHAIHFEKHATKPNDRLYSKGHYVSGLPKMLSMHRGHKAGMARLKAKINSEIKGKFTDRQVK